jgi:hypothetical protein
MPRFTPTTNSGGEVSTGAGAYALVALQPNRTSVSVGAPVLVDPIEISEPPGIVTLPVLVQVVPPPGTVQLSAVLAFPTRSVNVRESVRPGATLSETARSLAVIVALGVNELTLFSFASAASCPDGAKNLVGPGTAVPRPSTAPKAGLPFVPFVPLVPGVPCGPVLPCRPWGLSRR